MEVPKKTKIGLSCDPALLGIYLEKTNTLIQKRYMWDFPGGPVVKNPSCNAGDTNSIPGGELRSHLPWGN